MILIQGKKFANVYNTANSSFTLPVPFGPIIPYRFLWTQEIQQQYAGDLLFLPIDPLEAAFYFVNPILPL